MIRQAALAPAAGPAVDDQATALRRLVVALGGPAAHLPTPIAPEQDAGTQILALPGAGHARTLAVLSGKGGVGKTNLSVNLSVAFAQLNLRTTLLDGDLGLANADVLCGLNVRGHLGHVVDGVRSLDEIAVEAPGGFRLVPGAAGVAALADLDETRLANLVRAMSRLEASCDALVVDCGAGVGRAVMTFGLCADLALLVTTPEPTSVADAYATLKCLIAEGGQDAANRLALVVNQADGASQAASTHARINAVARKFLGVDLPMVGWIAADGIVSRAVCARRPFLLMNPSSRASRNVYDMAWTLRGRLGLTLGQREARPGFVRNVLRLVRVGS